MKSTAINNERRGLWWNARADVELTEARHGISNWPKRRCTKLKDEQQLKVLDTMKNPVPKTN